jgi:hypothetical protein
VIVAVVRLGLTPTIALVTYVSVSVPFTVRSAPQPPPEPEVVVELLELVALVLLEVVELEVVELEVIEPPAPPVHPVCAASMLKIWTHETTASNARSPPT